MDAEKDKAEDMEAFEKEHGRDETYREMMRQAQHRYRQRLRETGKPTRREFAEALLDAVVNSYQTGGDPYQRVAFGLMDTAVYLLIERGFSKDGAFSRAATLLEKEKNAD